MSVKVKGVLLGMKSLSVLWLWVHSRLYVPVDGHP